MGEVAAIGLEQTGVIGPVAGLEQVDHHRQQRDARGSSLAREIIPNTSISLSTVDP